VLENSADVGLTMMSPATNIGSIKWADSGSKQGAIIQYDHSGQAMELAVEDQSRVHMTSTETVINDSQLNLDFRVEGDGLSNVLGVDAGYDTAFVGAMPASDSSGRGVLFIANAGTNPSSGVADGTFLYSKDLSASSELYVMDEAGNHTLLSPHNFSLIPGGPSEDLAWAYFSERDGKKINVDMLKLARLVETLSGEKLVYEK
jgi:hypothetical protein